MTLYRNPRPSVRTPAELVALRSKLGDGRRISQYEALRMCELEVWLTRKTNEAYDEWLATKEPSDAVA